MTHEKIKPFIPPYTAKALNLTVSHTQKFIKIPTWILTEPEFKKLSMTGKMVYGFLRDKIMLADYTTHVSKNTKNYVDKNGMVFVKFSANIIADSLGISRQWAINTLQTLEDYGLIKIEKDNQYATPRIYVMDYEQEKIQTQNTNEVQIQQNDNQFHADDYQAYLDYQADNSAPNPRVDTQNTPIQKEIESTNSKQLSQVDKQVNTPANTSSEEDRKGREENTQKPPHEILQGSYKDINTPLKVAEGLNTSTKRPSPVDNTNALGNKNSEVNDDFRHRLNTKKPHNIQNNCRPLQLTVCP